MSSTTEDLMTLPEAAAALRVKESTLRAWRLQGRNLEFHKIGRLLRVKRSDIERLIETGNGTAARKGTK